MMSEDMLSQDEIDALLRGTDDDSQDQNNNQSAEEYLSPLETDALGEIGNISFGSSATALSTLLNQKVEITTPTVSIVNKKNLIEEFPYPYVGVQVNYTEGFSGSNLLIIKQSDAAIIVDLMLGGDGTNPTELMGEIQLSAVQEAMNQMMGSAATSMSTVFNKRVDISPPTIQILDVKQGQGTDQLPEDELMVRVSFRLKVGTLIDSSIMQLLPFEFSKGFVNELLHPGQSSGEKINPTADVNAENNVYQQMNSNDDAANTTADPNYVSSTSVNGYPQAATIDENAGIPPQSQQNYADVHQQQRQGPQHFGTVLQGGDKPNIQPVVFSNFEPQNLQVTETKNLNMLMDIPLQITVELGSTKRSVKDILELTAGSIIELDKLAGEPVDILVNSRLVAKGEVVVIDENFGVRVTDIISQSDRIKKLR